MVNPWTTLEGPVDWITAKKEADDRFLKQADKNIENIKEQGRQWVEASGQNFKMAEALVSFSSTLASGLQKSKAKKAEEEDQWKRTVERSW